jgi:Abnormal spindle-like microcephaly-assoc'd, ASPM-SPD-2-Hydin
VFVRNRSMLDAIRKRPRLCVLVAVVMAATFQSGCVGAVSSHTDSQSGPATISLSTASIQFGSVAVGTSTSQPVILTNTGSANLTVNQINLTGQEFSLSNTSLPMTIAGGASAQLTVGFAPTSAGKASGAISISSDSAVNPTSSVALSGTGNSGSSSDASVTLNWSASTSTGVVGYNIYRGTEPGSYAQLNGALISVTSYTDSTVQGGQNLTYYYAVTSVDSKGQQSAFSSPVSVLVP